MSHVIYSDQGADDKDTGLRPFRFRYWRWLQAAQERLSHHPVNLEIAIAMYLRVPLITVQIWVGGWAYPTDEQLVKVAELLSVPEEEVERARQAIAAFPTRPLPGQAQVPT